MKLTFESTVIEWRGPAPFYFVPVPSEECEQIAAVARAVSYGWGVIPVSAVIGSTSFTTSLFPKHGGYLLPIKQVVRTTEGLDIDDVISVQLHLDL